MDTYISLFKLHMNRHYKTGIIIMGIFLLIAVFAITIQIVFNNSPIIYQVVAIGKIMAFGGIFIFIRGRNGDGKFLSRLPISSLDVFIVKFITGIILYLAVFVGVNVLSEIIAFMLKIVEYKVSMSTMLSWSAFTSDFYTFFKIYLFFVFLVSLISFLERWMSAGEAIGLILVVPIVLSLLIPMVFKLFDINLHIDSNVLMKVKDIMKSYGTFIKVFSYLMFIGLGAFMFRLRNFKSF